MYVYCYYNIKFYYSVNRFYSYRHPLLLSFSPCITTSTPKCLYASFFHRGVKFTTNRLLTPLTENLHEKVLIIRYPTFYSLLLRAAHATDGWSDGRRGSVAEATEGGGLWCLHMSNTFDRLQKRIRVFLAILFWVTQHYIELEFNHETTGTNGSFHQLTNTILMVSFKILQLNNTYFFSYLFLRS